MVGVCATLMEAPEPVGGNLVEDGDARCVFQSDRRRSSPIHALPAHSPHPVRMTPFQRRLSPALLACLLATGTAAAIAQDRGLPDIGSSAGSMLSPARQAEYGAMVLAQLRHAGYVLDEQFGFLLRGQDVGIIDNPPRQGRKLDARL